MGALLECAAVLWRALPYWSALARSKNKFGPLANTLSVVIRRVVPIVFVLRVVPAVVTYGGSL
jgi:hypothetical protein